MNINELTLAEINEYYLKYGKNVEDWVEPEKKTVEIEIEIIEKPIPQPQPTRKSERDKLRYKVNYHNPLPPKPGHHRDHIIPISFCYELGLTLEQINHLDNLTYLTNEENINKFSFIGEEQLPHLNKMCKIWGIDIPNEDIIKEYNERQQTYYNRFILSRQKDYEN